jgi:hypothetical protein
MPPIQILLPAGCESDLAPVRSSLVYRSHVCLRLSRGRPKLLYACEIQKTANGGRSGAGRETRRTLQIFPERGLAPDGQNDERKSAARLCQDETQEASAKETERRHEPELEVPA